MSTRRLFTLTIGMFPKRGYERFTEKRLFQLSHLATIGGNNPVQNLLAEGRERHQGAAAVARILASVHKAPFHATINEE